MTYFLLRVQLEHAVALGQGDAKGERSALDLLVKVLVTSYGYSSLRKFKSTVITMFTRAYINDHLPCRRSEV